MSDEIGRLVERLRFCARMYDDVSSRECARAADALAATQAKLAEAEKERDEAADWSAIIERHGTDGFDALADAWLAQEGIQRVTNAVSSVFAKWANDDLMGRFKKHQHATVHLAFVEGCLAGVGAERVNSRTAEAERDQARAERDEARAQLSQARDGLMECETALLSAANQFKSYAAQHRAKQTPEAGAKADTNERMGRFCADKARRAAALVQEAEGK